MPDQRGTEQLLADVAHLRRYARALTGEQAGGDAYVAATIDALAGAGTGIGRAELFRTLTRIWNSVPVNHDGAADAAGQAPGDRRVARLTPLPRQAFLLSNLEGFSDAEGAAILGLTTTQFRDLIAEAGRELAEEMATDVLVIEDEPLIALDLETVLQDLGHRVIGVARTHTEAIQVANTALPGLILADIQLADGSSGLDAVNELIGSFSAPVVFVTAYPERFLTGKRPEPAFLVTKPFRTSHVAAVVSQALFFDRRARQKTQAA